ncbi:hypothetical protein QR680_004059 [Steinernema hermaphroditum]|uniref:Uncharacterized protein n=1 Tax=Steinernema hermaphroditum TaxID=289476 RepID=A0AA39HMI9_9BILA|nr:hypothetical protein QR680_004059 [Steinernema hermaphroditum]
MADARSTQTEQKLEVVEKEASLVSESKVAKVPIRCSPGKVAVDTDIGESCTASATPSSKDPETEIYDRSFVKTPIFHSIPYTDESTYPRAADKGVFGAAMKSAPLHLRIVVSWMFFDAGVQGTDRALTKYFNRISWTDLKIHEFTVIRMETLQLQTMEEEVLFHEKVHMKLIERALTSPPEIAHIPHNQNAAACLWVNHPTRIKKWTQALDKKTINKLSKFFHQVSENQFSRVAWFVCCLRNCGIAVPMHLHLIHIELLVQPMCYYEQGPRKLSFLRRYLKMLEKTTVESGGIGQWNEDVENPLYCEENVGYPSLTKLRRLIEARANADATQRKQEALKYIETVLMNKLRQEEWNVKLPTFPFICKS